MYLMESESLAQNSATGPFFLNQILSTAFIQYFCNTYFNEFYAIHNLCIDWIYIIVKPASSGFGGAEVACWPLIPKFAGSNPAEAVRFLKGDKKSSARLPSEGK